MTEWFSAKEVAEKLAISKQTVHNWANRWQWKCQAAYIEDSMGKKRWGFEYLAEDVLKTLKEVNKDKFKKNDKEKDIEEEEKEDEENDKKKVDKTRQVK